MLLSGIIIDMLKNVVDHLHKTPATATPVDFIPKSGTQGPRTYRQILLCIV